MVKRWLSQSRSSIPDDEYVILDIKVKPAKDYTTADIASKIAKHISLGTESPLEYETPERRKAVSAKVLSCSDNEIELAFPRNVTGYHAGYPQLLSTVYFPAEYGYIDGYFIKDIELPPSFREDLPGPKYGIDGIREIFGVDDRPVLGTVIKPRMGVSRDIIVEHCRSALVGGVDFIVDDELIVDPENSMNFHERLESMVTMVAEVERTTGESKAYIPNVTARPTKMHEYAEAAQREGADAVVLNGFTLGFHVLRQFRESPEFDLPIINTNIGEGILTRYSLPSEGDVSTGVSNGVIRKFSRFYGSDAIHIGTAKSETYEVGAPGLRATSIDGSYPGIKESIPVVAGGLTIDNLAVNIQNFGTNTIFESGRGILAYPSGPEDGAKAFRTLLEEINPQMDEETTRETIIDIADRYSHISKAIDSIPDPVS